MIQLKKLLKSIKPHFHNFSTRDLSILEGRFLDSAHYGNSLFDNSTYHAKSYIRANCLVCCEPDETIYTEYYIDAKDRKQLFKYIKSFNERHSVVKESKSL